MIPDKGIMPYPPSRSHGVLPFSRSHAPAWERIGEVWVPTGDRGNQGKTHCTGANDVASICSDRINWGQIKINTHQTSQLFWNREKEI